MDWYKKFVVGVCLDESLKNYEKFFEQYGKCIKTIYFNYYIDPKYSSRGKIAKQYQNNENRILVRNVIYLAKMYNILTELCLNTPNLSKESIDDAISFIKEMNIDRIVCVDEYVNYLSEKLPDLYICRSFNSSLSKYTIINQNYDEIVVAKNFLQDIDDLKGFLTCFDLQLLVNNGCIFGCPGCYNLKNGCASYFNTLCNAIDLNYMFALYSFFPKELIRLVKQLEKYKDIISFKINNRTTNLKITGLMLDAYMEKIDYISLVKKDKRFLALFCILSHFYTMENFKELNVDEIIHFKRIIYKIDVSC